MTQHAAYIPELFNLDAYFARIGYGGPRTTTLETLQAIIQQHTQTIPFENLNPFLRLPVKLDIESLQNKLVHSPRGGFCFEQNGLLRHVLSALGFRSKPLGARVVWNSPPDYTPPRTHMVQLVIINGQHYMVDVGFGGMTPTSVLLLEPDTIQETPHEPYRFVAVGEEFVLEAFVGEMWQALYRFDLTEQMPIDYELSNFWVCHHPDSHFISGISAALMAPGRRYALRNNQLAIHYTHKPSEKRMLTSVNELRDTLENLFGIAIPTEVDADSAMQQLIAQS